MARANLLIVEDQSIIALDLGDRLNRLGYAVVGITAFAEAAVQLAGETQPDLILMDIRLKGAMDGIQAAEEIRVRHGLPVIFLTAHSDDATLRRARSSEPYGYILKPFEDRELVLAIEIGLDKHRLTQQLRENERRFSAILNGIGEGVITTDLQNRITYLNPAAESLLGWRSGEAKGRRLEEVYAVVDPAGSVVSKSGSGLGATSTGLASLPSRTHVLTHARTEILLEDRLAPIRDEAGQVNGTVLVFRDITQGAQTESHLSYLMYNDPTTGLPNRTLFHLIVAEALSRARRDHSRGAVLLLDLDRFANINESFGHVSGDRLLQVVAARLTGIARLAGSVARLGGDEFAVLVTPLATAQAASDLAEQILIALATPIDVEGQEIFVTASIGVALYPENGLDVETLLQNADTALHRAKRLGRNQCASYRSGMNSAARTHLALDGGLRRALERNEFELHYQPKVDSWTGRTLGAEALLRWQSPELGSVSPGEFISLAEDTGLIVPIGQWALQAACQQAKSWVQAGFDIRIAVNLSPRQFGQQSLVDDIARTLEVAGLPGRALELELTESSLVRDYSEALRKLLALKELGVVLSIDDFGTGYSSLAYLRQFQVDILKIDRLFVAGSSESRGNGAIVRAIIGLGHNLDLRVTAEGVETAEQLAFLQESECDEIQGFFLGRPMPATELSSRLVAKEALQTTSFERPAAGIASPPIRDNGDATAQPPVRKGKPN